MNELSLKERMSEVTSWLGVAATRTLEEADYELARTEPESFKRAFDGQTFGTTYLARHAARNLKKGQTAKGLAQALPVPLLGAASLILFPFGSVFVHRLDQKRLRSEQATRENAIAYEFRYACEVAQKLSRDDQLKMLKDVHGMTRKDVMAWACTCLAMGAKTLQDVEQGNDRIRNSRLVLRRAKKMSSAIRKMHKRYLQ